MKYEPSIRLMSNEHDWKTMKLWYVRRLTHSHTSLTTLNPSWWERIDIRLNRMFLFVHIVSKYKVKKKNTFCPIISKLKVNKKECNLHIARIHIKSMIIWQMNKLKQMICWSVKIIYQRLNQTISIKLCFWYKNLQI